MFEPYQLQELLKNKPDTNSMSGVKVKMLEQSKEVFSPRVKDTNYTQRCNCVTYTFGNETMTIV